MTKLSILDLSPITEGSTAATALANSLDLARHAESLGYHRYWVAEHHNMPGIASAATAVVIGHIAAGTEIIRVGAGGIMLPNHAPLVVAEQFGTLEALHPGRIDLGLGRAPGTDGITSQALRRTLHSDPNQFPRDVAELRGYLQAPQAGQQVKAVPGQGTEVPLYILGSSLFGAQVAAHFGLPFAFASHFASGDLMPAIEIYRQQFTPSAQLSEPYVILGYQLCAADTEEEASLLHTSALQSFLNLRSGKPGPLPPPRAGYQASLAQQERAILSQITQCSAVGDRAQVGEAITLFAERTGADELIMTANIFDHTARMHAYTLAMEACFP